MHSTHQLPCSILSRESKSTPPPLQPSWFLHNPLIGPYFSRKTALGRIPLGSHETVYGICHCCHLGSQLQSFNVAGKKHTTWHNFWASFVWLPKEHQFKTQPIWIWAMHPIVCFFFWRKGLGLYYGRSRICGKKSHQLLSILSCRKKFWIQLRWT